MIRSVPNLRPIAGLSTANGGRIRDGLLFRSGDLSRVEGADAAAIASLGIRTVYDLRSPEEQRRGPDRLPPAATRIGLDVLGDAQGVSPVAVLAAFDDPERARAAFGGERIAAFWRDAYDGFVALPSARSAYGRLFRGLAEDDPLPALIHCTTGKDRTGWAVAVLLLRLGASRDAIMADYLRSNEVVDLLLSDLAPLLARGGDPELLRGFLGVDAAYLNGAIRAMEGRFGNVAGYLADGLGIEPAVQERLIERLVTPAGSRAPI